MPKTDYSYIASAEVTNEKITTVGTSGRTFKSISVFSKTDIAAYYNDDFDSKINVFVFCNPTLTLKNILKEAKLGDSDWFNKFGTYVSSDSKSEVIWAERSFLMSNSEIATRYLPSTLADWDNYSTEASPFNLSGMNSLGRPNEVDNYMGGKGNIMVERTAARFDFRDGSVDKTGNGIGNQTYKVLFSTDRTPYVNVKLGKMSLVNMNKNYYFLKRVSPKGLNNEVTLCGPELPWYSTATGTYLEGNYVVDVDAEWKFKPSLPNPTPTDNPYATHFNYPFFDSSGNIDNADAENDRWDTKLISEVIGNSNTDNWNSDMKYHIWRYCTENTIPGRETQRNSISTGIVFKGQLQPAMSADKTDDQATKDLLNALEINENESAGNGVKDPILYLFAGHLYCGWDNVRQMALSLAISDLKQNGTEWEYTINRSGALYNAVFGTGGFGTFKYSYKKEDGTYDKINLSDNTAEDPNSANAKYNTWKSDTNPDNFSTNLDNFKKAAVTANITIYQRSYDEQLGGWGYYCYYFYWNRHNNNGQNGVMGPMEFAVVRNNVYKLAVTNIARLGHPRIAINDPDAPNPNTQDEKSNIYLTVNCTTLPWVVRVNDIEF